MTTSVAQRTLMSSLALLSEPAEALEIRRRLYLPYFACTEFCAAICTARMASDGVMHAVCSGGRVVQYVRPQPVTSPCQLVDGPKETIARGATCPRVAPSFGSPSPSDCTSNPEESSCGATHKSRKSLCVRYVDRVSVHVHAATGDPSASRGSMVIT